MGVFGSVLGGILTMLGLFLSIWIMGTIAPGLIIFILFPIFGILGGLALGALNGRNARLYAKYRNEYVAYAAMMFAAILLFGAYYFIFGTGGITAKNASGFEDTLVVIFGMLSGALIQLGLGLVIANSLAE